MAKKVAVLRAGSWGSVLASLLDATAQMLNCGGPNPHRLRNSMSNTQTNDISRILRLQNHWLRQMI